MGISRLFSFAELGALMIHLTKEGMVKAWSEIFGQDKEGLVFIDKNKVNAFWEILQNNQAQLELELVSYENGFQDGMTFVRENELKKELERITNQLKDGLCRL